MVENKKPLLEGESNINHTFIIPQNISEEQLLDSVPSILKDAIKLLNKKHVNTPIKCILNVLIVKLAQMITSKRVQYKKINEQGFPNWYAIVFMDSGIGKDYLVKDLDRLVFKNFGLWFSNKVELYRHQEEKLIEEKASKEFKGTRGEEKRKTAFIQAEKAKIRNIFIEVSAGTQEGFYSDAEALSFANFGSVFLKISELGGYLSTLTTETKQFFNCLYEAYDGKVISKSIKGENRKADLVNIPVNTLLYSDPNMFKGELEKIFNNLMLTGISRRAMLSFRVPAPLEVDNLTAEQLKDLESKLEAIGENLNTTFLNISDGSIYELESTAYDNFLISYKNICIEKSNNIDDANARREINSHFYKALKLSCIYACLNHPTQLNITSEDLQQAIITVEALGTDLEAFTNFRPKYNDKYDNLFFYLKNNLGKKFKKTDFSTSIYKEIDGLVRADVKANFDTTIEYVKEIAQNQGYILLTEKGYNNLGEKYCLVKNQNENNILELKQLLVNTTV